MASSTVVRQIDAVQGMLHKSVIALAIVPTNKSLTVTGRKAYSVMLHLAQMQVSADACSPDGGFTAPLNSILHGFGSTNTIAVQAKRYIDHMVSTRVEWRPLSKSESQLTLALTPDDDQQGEGGLPVDPDDPSGSAITSELRIFNLLAEVRIFKRAGQNWCTWFYPPSIREELINPSRWAQVDFDVLSKLTTYAAVALYEICARYRDNPAGVTSRQHWSWWMQALRSSPTTKLRAWRKFKSEFVAPAIREINSLGDIELELVEFRRGREIEHVQFGVKKVSRSRPLLQPSAPDITNIIRASAFGIRDTVVEEMERDYGSAAVADALNRYERAVTGPAARVVPFPVQYIKAILSNKSGTLKPPSDSSAVDVVSSGPKPLSSHLPPLSESIVEDPSDQRFELIRQRFASLSHDEQHDLVMQVKAIAESTGGPSPGAMKRLSRGEWQSPLVQLMVIRHYAQSEFGPDWRTIPLSVLSTSV